MSPQGIKGIELYSIKPTPIATPTSDTKTTLSADDSLGSAPLLGVDEAVDVVVGTVLVEFEVVVPNASAFARNAA